MRGTLVGRGAFLLPTSRARESIWTAHVAGVVLLRRSLCLAKYENPNGRDCWKVFEFM